MLRFFSHVKRILPFKMSLKTIKHGTRKIHNSLEILSPSSDDKKTGQCQI